MVDFAKAAEDARREREMYIIYTDGRGIFEKDPQTGYNTKQIACERTYVILCNGSIVKKEQKQVDVVKGIEPTNITGECSAVLHGLAETLKLALAFNYKGKIQIMHDYIGLSHWANGTWKTKAQVSILYAEAVKKLITLANKNGIEVEFVKVPSTKNQAHILFYGGQ
jgi:ribonuclease HI